MFSPVEIILTLEQLEERVIYWQKLLRLQDWRIVVQMCRSRDIGECDAQCEQKPSLRQALIKIAEPADWDPAVPLPLDMEWSLVHEMLHIVWGLPTAHLDRSTGGPEVWAMESAIEATTHALIGLERIRQQGG